MKNKLFTLLFLLNLNILTASPGEASAVFLLIGPGAGAVATGEAQVAKSDDAYATYYNPAGLGFQTGQEYAGMHVNWLPGLADDINYEFAAFKKKIPWLGTVGGNVTFLNLGEQTQTNENGQVIGTFRSYMAAVAASYGTMINNNSAWGINFKVIHQKLAPQGTGGEGSGAGSSTDFAFDVGYLMKTDKLNFGLSISNIGPEVDFVDAEQGDPLPTNLKMGIFTNLYESENTRLNLLFDANKMLVARYGSMDWNGNGVLDTNKEINGYSDPWYKALYTSWLDDWYYGGDINVECSSSQGCPEDVNGDGQFIIGGYDKQEIVVGGAEDGIVVGYETIPTLEVDNGAQGIFDGYNEEWDSWEVYTDDNENGIYDDGEDFIDTTDEFLNFDDPNYGIYNSDGVKEKGTADDRSFSSELEEMVYSLGLEYWYTNSFVFRLGYLHDQEGNLKHPTLGAGIKFGQYGFDLGYILGKEGEPRANTLLFSLNMTM
tara:strand:- start:8970 stop:10430 length:1461 start_codon:yes stop_codon:yes gene_type:complete